MPNTSPPTTTAETLAWKVERAKATAWVDFAFYLGATRENAAQLGALEQAEGCCGVKCFLGSSTGTLLLDLNVTDLTSSIDTTWAATTGHTWLRGTSVVNHGLFAGTETFHFVFDTPTRLDEFRVYIEALHGAVSIDQWCLTASRNGWAVGRLAW